MHVRRPVFPGRRTWLGPWSAGPACIASRPPTRLAALQSKITIRRESSRSPAFSRAK